MRSGSATLSSALRWVSSRKSWKTTPMRRRSSGTSRRRRLSRSRPNRLTRPLAGRSDRYISRSSDDLPAPLGPTRKWNDPGASVNEAPWMISGPAPERTPTFSNNTNAVASRPEPRGRRMAQAASHRPAARLASPGHDLAPDPDSAIKGRKGTRPAGDDRHLLALQDALSDGSGRARAGRP